MKELHLWIAGFCCMKKLKYRYGQKVGNCIYQKEAFSKLGSHQRAYFKCECGAIFTASVTAVKSGRTTSCGCISRRGKHQLSRHSLYAVWIDIKGRCYNKNNPSYINYGGRGITICNEWRDDFKVFYDYMIKLPKYGIPGLTIDRINNDGNYEPGNIRFATRIIQITNRRKNKNNSSGYTGVSFVKGYGKYESAITINYKHIRIGYADTAMEAANMRDKYIIEHDLLRYKLQTL